MASQNVVLGHIMADRMGRMRWLIRQRNSARGTVPECGPSLRCSVWCEIESCEPFAAIEAAITEVFGADDAAGYREGPWGFPDGELLLGEMSAAGFADIALSRDEITVVFDNPDHLIATLGAAPIGAKVQHLDQSGYQELRIALENASTALTHNGVIRGTTTAHTAIGTT